MTDIFVEWRLAGWAENTLAIKDVLDRAARLEEARSKKTDKALEEWMETFRDEHAKRILAEQKARQERSMRQQLAKGDKNGSEATT